MCYKCDYPKMLENTNLPVTENRLRVLEIIGNNHYPLSADEIYHTLDRNRSINRVTVYRQLNLLVENNLVERHSGGGRSAFYGLAPNENHRPHPHFYCRHCDLMVCLSPDSLTVDTEKLAQTFPGEIDRVEVRVDGLCRNCTKEKLSRGKV